MAAKKSAARKQVRPGKARKKATRRAAKKSAPKQRAATPTEDVVYSDVRREMRSGLLARFR
jgi:hypothetical protein